MEQLVCKWAANTGYGACAASNTLMTCTDLSEQTTATARLMFVQINEGIKNISRVKYGSKSARQNDFVNNMKITHGDTDSTLISNVNQECIEALCLAINTAIEKAFPSSFITLNLNILQNV